MAIVAAIILAAPPSVFAQTSRTAPSPPIGRPLAPAPPGSLGPAGDNRPVALPGGPRSERLFGPLTEGVDINGRPLRVAPTPMTRPRPSEIEPDPLQGKRIAPVVETPDETKAKAEKIKRDLDAAKAEPLAAGPNAGAGATAAAAAQPPSVPKDVIQDLPKAKLPEAPYSGSYTTSIEIEVPKFRGLEPKLRLAYDSNRSTSRGLYRAGQVGVGWSLEGLPDIVRASAIGGAPRFGASDVYSFDGEQLELCLSNMTAASCAAFNDLSQTDAYTTRFESFQRIRYFKSTAINRWEVTARDGVRYVFQPASYFGATGPIASGSRWLLAQAIDPSGNVVTYTYSCGEAPICTPNTITYGGTQIIFSWQLLSGAQHTPPTIATGAGLAAQPFRLRAIRINNAGGVLAAYKLVYEDNATTNVSRLTQVWRYGKDAAFDAQTGEVNGGNALPPHQFAYQNAPQFALGNTGESVGPLNAYCDTSGTPGFTPNLVASFNSDQKDDIIVWCGRVVTTPGPPENPQPAPVSYELRLQLALSGTNGFSISSPSVSVPLELSPAPPGDTAPPQYTYPFNQYRVTAADMDGDGVSELIVSSNYR